MDFIQLPLSHEYKCVLVMVCMFPQRTEAFPCTQVTASSVAKILLEKFISTCRSPLELYSDFLSQVL